MLANTMFGIERCRREISTCGERQRSFPHRLSGVLQGLLDVTRFEVRIGFEDLGLRHSVGDHADHAGHRDAQASNAGNAAHLVRVHGDPGEFHVRSPACMPLAFYAACHPGRLGSDPESSWFSLYWGLTPN